MLIKKETINTMMKNFKKLEYLIKELDLIAMDLAFNLIKSKMYCKNSNINY